MTVVRSAVVISLLTLVAKAIGIFRQTVFAHTFGAGRDIDIYVAAFRLPDLILNLLIMGTLSAAFIPVFVGVLQKDRKKATEVASTIFNLTLLMMLVFSLAGYAASPWLVKIIVPGFDANDYARTLELTRILMIAPVFFGLSAVLTGILQANKRFVLAAFSPIFYNLAIIGGVYLLFPKMGLPGLAWGAAIGAATHFLIQLPAVLRTGLRPLSVFKIGAEVKKIVKLFVPRVLGLDLGQISMFFTAIIGSTLASGSLAVYSYAYDLQIAPLGLLVVPFAVAAFPTMSEYLNKNDLTGFRNFFAKSVTQMLYIIIPGSVLMLLLRAQIVRLILGAGQNTQFDFAATRMTAQALGFFALSLFAQALTPLLARSFYALHNTIIPVITGVIAAVVNIVLAYLFTRIAGPETLALAFSIAAVVNMFILLIILHRKIGGLNDDFLVFRSLKIIVASIVMAAVVYLTLYSVAPFVDMQTYAGVLAQTVIACIAAAVSYFVCGLLVSLPETKQVFKSLSSWFSQK